jgi:dethiobiotin synthetase
VRGLFVTGTDTGVGKTILSAALLATMAVQGEPARAHKPVLTGLDEQPAHAWPPDHELLGAAADMAPNEVAALRYGPAVSPHLAAALAGRPIEPADLLSAARAAATAAAGEQRALIVEGVGGLLTPLAEDFSICDLAAALGLGVLIAARPGLGTINHTLLTLAVARAAGLDVRAVVLTPWPRDPSQLERSNRATIERIGAVAVELLSEACGPDPAALARAGESLPWRSWLGEDTWTIQAASAAASTTAAVTAARSSSSMTYGGIV